VKEKKKGGFSVCFEEPNGNYIERGGGFKYGGFTPSPTVLSARFASGSKDLKKLK
jgi:hypothetical protein